MAVNAGEVSVALSLEDADFRAGLAAAQTSLEQFARELAALAVPPDVGAALAGLNLDVSAQFAAAGGQAGEAFAAGIATAAPSASAAALGLAGAAGLALGAAGLGAAPAGLSFAAAYAGGIGAGASQASAGAAAMSAGAVSAAGSGLSGASSIGQSFAAGLASGIRAGRSGVVNAAASVARAAAAAARSALAIHSPSKVTEEFGEYFDLGFIRGVERLAPDIEDSVRAAVRVAPPAGIALGAATVPAAQARGLAIDYDRLAEAMDRRRIVLTMNDRRVAEAMSAATARTQAERNRSIALGYGKR